VADRDFSEYDYILVMDSANYNHLTRRAPEQFHGKIQRLLSFSRKYPNLDVPDPYYGGTQGFDENLDMIQDAIQNLVREINGQNGLAIRRVG
jgi:protein-tyrosine phosphatase